MDLLRAQSPAWHRDRNGVLIRAFALLYRLATVQHKVKARDLLLAPVLVDLDLVLLEIRHGMPIAVSDRHIDLDKIRRDLYDILLRSGCRRWSLCGRTRGGQQQNGKDAKNVFH